MKKVVYGYGNNKGRFKQVAKDEDDIDKILNSN